jgi:hypothetical protein
MEPGLLHVDEALIVVDKAGRAGHPSGDGQATGHWSTACCTFSGHRAVGR